MTGYLSSEATWRGQFWLPGRSGRDDQQGILSYKPDSGVALSLIRGFTDGGVTRSAAGGVSFSESTGRFPVIHGVAGNERVTLLDCLVTRSTQGMFNSQTRDQEIRAERLLLGVLLDDGDNRAFSGLTIELENLTTWDHRQDVMLRIMQVDSALHGGERWAIEVDQAPPLSATAEGLTIELHRRYVEPSGQVQRHGIETSTFTASYLTVTSPEPKSLDEWDAIGKKLQDLLTFAMDSPCAILRETLVPSDVVRTREATETRSMITSFAQQIVVGDPEAPSVEARKAFFTLGRDGIEFQSVIERWWEVHSQFNVACDMILGLRYLKGGYLQTDLITAVGAAEALHEGLGFDPPMSKREFAAVKESLLDQVTEEHKTWLREKLGHNSRTLRTKLIDLADSIDPEVVALVLPNREAWAAATKNERDPVAHGGKDMSSDPWLLNAIVTTTTAVVLLNLLQQLGIPKERLRFAVYDNPSLAAAARFAKKQWPAGSVTN